MVVFFFWIGCEKDEERRKRENHPFVGGRQLNKQGTFTYDKTTNESIEKVESIYSNPNIYLEFKKLN